jgi:hypothetical protein
MEDSKIAKIILSDLIGKNIITLSLKPQEYTIKLEKRSLLVYRIDFKAKIELEDGTKKLVLIELQKAKQSTDIMRFRRYLGEQYASYQNTYKKGNKKHALPIITIYFLGHRLDAPIESPIIKVKRTYLDHTTKEIIDAQDSFIESLTHDSIIVQLPLLKHKRRNEIETVLSLFDADKGYEISIDESIYPEKYQPVIRKLLEAIADSQMRKKMEIEDEIEEYFRAQEEIQMELEKAKEKWKEERVKLEQKQQELEQEKQRSEQLEKEKIDVIKELLAENMPLEKIMQITKTDMDFLIKYRLIK